MRSPRLNVVKKSAIPGNGASHPPNTPPRAIELELSDPSTTQPRQHFDDDALLQLAASIRLHGVIQPIVVRPRGARDTSGSEQRAAPARKSA